MTASVVYLQGRSTPIAIPAGSSIAVFSQSDLTVSRLVGFPNEPDKLSLLGQITAVQPQQTFGPYATGANIVLEANAAQVIYEIGVTPVVQVQFLGRQQPVPATLNATGTITTLGILNGLITSTTAAAVTATLPTGTVMDASSQFAINDSIDWSVIATGANGFTVTAATGHTIVGTAVVATVTSGHFRTVKTAANTFVTYRMS